jgi:VWFA-related protein
MKVKPSLSSMRAGGFVACLVAGLASAASPARAQEPVKPDVLAPLSVEVVRIEVMVTEKGSRARAGLKREDFAVFEDGKPQEIVQFQAFERPLPGAASQVAAAAAAAEATAEGLLPARYVVLVIDDLHLEFASLVRVQKALARFITEDLGPEDQVALVTTSGAKALSQEFTADRAVLRQTLSRLSLQNRLAGWSGVPYMSEYQAQLIEAGDPLALEAAVVEIMNASSFEDVNSAEALARQKARVLFSEAVYAARLTLETLESLARGLSGVSGRKALYLVSDGFLTGLGVASGSGFDMRRIADASTRAGVVIYALDTRGLIASPPSASASSLTRTPPATVGLIDAMHRRSEWAARDAMNSLAADTGGFMVQNSNDLRDGLKQMLRDSETYYVLAYEPSNTKRDGSFRKIEVRLPGVRGVKVRTRSGYLAPDDRRASLAAGPSEIEARRAEQRQAEMRTALYSLAPLSTIPVRLSADFVSSDGGATQLVVSGHVGVETLPFVRLRGRYQATIEAAAVVQGEDGATAATLPTERSVMDLSDAEYRQLLARGLAYERAIAVPPGQYQVRFAVREDAMGLLGSAWQRIEVPNLAPDRLTLSSLFLLKENQSGQVPRDPDGPPDLSSAQALRRYHRGDSLYAQVYAYNAKRDASGAVNLVSQAEILRGGQSLGTAAPEPIEPAAAPGAPLPHTTRIRLQRFEPGDYELRLTVTDRNASAMATRRVAFTID